MQFSIGDSVVHLAHGPGRILGIEPEVPLLEGHGFYVIEIPSRGLTVHTPADQADDGGVRPAMSACRRQRLLAILAGKPRLLPDDFYERQAELEARLSTGRVLQLARVVRDLMNHRARAHLTRPDTAHLNQGRDRLAAEMALVSGESVEQETRRINTALARIPHTG
jgi:CarD family transcriptional regulator